MPILTSLRFSYGPKNYELTPTFDSSTVNYTLNITNPNLKLTAISDGYLPILKINNYKPEGVPSWNSESNTFEYSLVFGELKKGKNIIDIIVEESSDPLNLNRSFYRVTLNYNDIQPDKPWPIQEHLLSPGFYGGSYVPNYRLLKEIFTCGSGDNDFENNYETLALSNEEAIQYLNDIIGIYTNKGVLDAIVESFVHYSGFVNSNWVDDGDYRYYLPLIEVGVDRPDHMRNNFKPKNNKLFSYPYTSLKIMGYGGESELKYELFPENIRFGIVSKFFAGASVQLYPVNYEGILDAYSAGVTGQPLPVFPYTKDEYLNDYNASMNTRNASVLSLEENKKLGYVSSAISAVSSIGSLATGAGLGAGMDSTAMSAGGVISGIGGLADAALSAGQTKLQYNQGMRAMAATLKDTEARPSSIANQNASPSIPGVMKDAVVPFVQRHSIREVFAKKIDNFFTRYGYRVNRVGIPKITSRPAFNFLRCTEAHVEGNIPNEDLLQIKAVLEHGVTFWHNHDVGNYNLSNPAPITNKPRYCQPVG